MDKITLDARELEHPKPLEEASRILQKLDNSSYMYMLHRKNPIPLLDLANEHGFQTLSTQIGDDWHIIICKDQQINLEELLDV
jgi:hypothetical protein